MQAARGASLTNSGQPEVPSDHPRGSIPAGSRRPLLLFVVVALAAYALDLVTKVVAVDRLTESGPVRVVGDVLQFDLQRNPGAAFSTGTSYTVVLTCIALAAVATVLWYSRRLASPLWAFGLGCLLGGVLGNLTDRIFREPGVMRGHVVDFIRLPHWPVFNVADVCINVAAGVIILQAIRGVSLTGERDRPVPDSPEPADPGVAATSESGDAVS